ncbi:hypothetical protein BYT27DRAFT_7343486 [Phlegmacium glaucopus]|nr:hypothetical protein BYT27DRAFT_7343486 [Phlegmacium glaucopus]
MSSNEVEALSMDVSVQKTLTTAVTICRRDIEQNETAIVEMKINLLKARPSRPEGNTTCANNLTTTVANQMNNVDTAGIFIILWTFTGITASKDPVEVGVVTEFGIERRFE